MAPGNRLETALYSVYFDLFIYLKNVLFFDLFFYLVLLNHYSIFDILSRNIESVLKKKRLEMS